MIARCARCQGTFTADRFGLQVCPHCGSELLLADPDAPATPAAAGPVQPAPGAAPVAGPAPAAGAPPGGFAPMPPPAGGSELPSPFADRGRVGFLAGFLQTLKLVATRPEEFFRRVRVDQTGSAVLFAALAFTVGTVFQTLYAVLLRGQVLALFERLSPYLAPEQMERLREALRASSASESIAQIVFAPVVAVASVYILSAVMHVVLLVLSGAPRGFGATLTVTAYASGLTVLLALPFCGGLLAGVWAMVSTIVGLGQAQRCGAGKAAVAVLSPAILACVCCCGMAGLGAPALLKGLGDVGQGASETTL